MTPAVSPTPTLSPTPQYTPTPRPTRRPPSQITRTYTVQYGDTLLGIASFLGLTVDELMEANGLTDADSLQMGQVLQIPTEPDVVTPAEILIPNSELVYGPGYADFDVSQAVAPYAGFLRGYTETLYNGEVVSGIELIERVALEYSVGPRVLLALLEAQSGWLTDPEPPEGAQDYPLGYERDGWEGLAVQLGWAANALNRGFYGWLYDDLWTFRLGDGVYAQFAMELNAGTAGIQRAIGPTTEAAALAQRLDHFAATYRRLWGDPFAYTVPHLLPPEDAVPTLSFPWAAGETWHFTGGPHGGWGNGSAWAAVDFATDERNLGCAVSNRWVTAAADGTVVYSDRGLLLQELDDDNFAGSGWVLLYMHVAAEERAPLGAQLNVGDPVGHPSCEGGSASASHLHFARRYNGVWIAADVTSPWPLVLDGWQVRAGDRPYDGALFKGGVVKTAEESWVDVNAITN
jgi:murein DD-endopeptidase MepM/ murein hydrolase activator NlpD